MAKKRSIEQNLFDVYYPRIGVIRVSESDISPEILDEFLGGSQPTRSIGISAVFDSKGKLAVLAVALAAKVLLIESKGSANDTISEARILLQDRILCSNDNVIYAFDIAPIALALFVDQHLRLANGVDFQTVPGNPNTNRDQIAAIKFITAGSNATIHPENIRALFDDSTWDPENRNCETFLALRAWTAAYLSTFNGDAENRFRDAKRVNTMVLSDTVRDITIHICFYFNLLFWNLGSLCPRKAVSGRTSSRQREDIVNPARIYAPHDQRQGWTKSGISSRRLSKPHP